MADRYPLIFDSSDNKFKELPSGDNLNLNNSPIINVPSIECEGVITGRTRFSVYNDTVISTNVTLTSSDMNKVLLLNTSSARTVVLPIGSSIEVGDWIKIVDIGTGESNSGNANTNNITVSPNVADRIQGGSAGDTLIIDVNKQELTLMWCGSTYDWRIVNMDKYEPPIALPSAYPDEYKTQLLAALPLNSVFGITDQSPLVRGSGSAASVVNYFDAGAAITIQEDRFKYYGSSARKPLSSPAGTVFRESHININTGSGTQFGTGDFCMEAWIKTEDFTFAGQDRHGICFPRWRNNNADLFGYVPNIVIWSTSQGFTTQRSIRLMNPEETSSICQTGAVLTENVWHHIAITRQGNTHRIWVDGTLRASGNSSINWVGYEYWMFANQRILGSNFNIQDIRIYKGTPKYTTTFTLPRQIFIE